MSFSLTDRQRDGLRKVGDLMVPGDDELPSFSESGAAEHADGLLESLSRGDREDFCRLLSVFYWLPGGLIVGLLRLHRWSRWMPFGAGDFLRRIYVGVKGVVMSLYYSDWTSDLRIHRVLGWDARVSTPEESIPADQKRSREALETAQERARWSE